MSNSISKSPNKYDLVKDTLVLILAGGRGSRLYELTDKRAKPALYFGGNRRIIDFALSNCINSGLNHIGVVTQYAAHSLLRHLQKGWSFLPQERGEFIDMLPARQQIDDSTWYRGTADAVYQNMAIIRDHYCPKYILILAGDHIYKQDYSQMLLDHVSSNAKCTVGCIEVEREKACEFGVMAVDENLKVKAFVEKPKDPPAMAGKPNVSLASMGIYVFNADYLYDIYQSNEQLRRVIDQITSGFFSPNDPHRYQDLLNGLYYHDYYQSFADFQSYVEAQKRVDEKYRDKKAWTNSALQNIVNMSFFSSDRTIKEYAEKIWKVKPLMVK